MNLFDLFIKIGVDDDASSHIEKLSSKLSTGLQTAAKIGAAAVATAAAGIAALTKAAVDNYAEYEQLVGGVETLFKESADIVIKYAENAYKTAGMSANDYMANATAFSASLISSLAGDTEAAAEYANRAMVSMSDNANKMGTNIDIIVQTYQSLSRGNFAMLDNLKLGYGGTKAELERLIADAASYTEIQKEMGIVVDASSTSFANIVNAIAVVQGHLGIAGATAAEAATTIEGSVNSMKSAWHNLVTGVADDNADFDRLMDNFVESVSIAGKNILPRIQIALEGAARLVSELAPVIVEQLPVIMEAVLPSLIDATADLIVALAEQLPSIAGALVDASVQIVDQIGEKFAEKIPALGFVFENLEVVVSGATAAFVSFKASVAISSLLTSLTTATEGVTLAQAALNAVMAVNPFIFIATAIAALVTAIITLYNTNEDFRNFVQAAWAVIKEAGQSLVDDLIGAFDLFMLALDEVENFVSDTWDTIEASAKRLVNNVSTFFKVTIPNALNVFTSKVRNTASSVKESFSNLISNVENFVDNLKTKFNNIVDALSDAFSDIIDFSGDVVNTIIDLFSGDLVDSLGDIPDKMVDIGGSIVEGIWEGIEDGWDWLLDAVEGLVDDLIDAAEDALDINSPSRVMRDRVGKNISLGVAEGIIAAANAPVQAMTDLSNSLIKQVPVNSDLSFGTDYGSQTGGNYGGGTTVIQNIYSQAQTAADLMREAIYEQERAVLMGV